jgi:putative SOS response-associated peptidase YedK
VTTEGIFLLDCEINEGIAKPDRAADITVITTDPNEVVQPMHDRMPVIIAERDYESLVES